MMVRRCRTGMPSSTAAYAPEPSVVKWAREPHARNSHCLGSCWTRPNLRSCGCASDVEPVISAGVKYFCSWTARRVNARMRQRHETRLYARQPSSPLVLGPQGGELDQSRDAFSRVAKMLQVEGLQASACCERCHFRALNGETCEGQIQVAKLCKVSKRRHCGRTCYCQRVLGQVRCVS
jgi:hypothetical protein